MADSTTKAFAEKLLKANGAILKTPDRPPETKLDPVSDFDIRGDIIYSKLTWMFNHDTIFMESRFCGPNRALAPAGGLFEVDWEGSFPG